MSPKPDTIRIAAAQYPIERFDTLAAYKGKLARWVENAAADGAELLVFPEYGAMEYAGAGGDAAVTLAGSLAAAAAARREMDEAHSALAQAHNVIILGASGPVGLADGRIINRATLFSPSGTRGHHDKRMMTPFERDWGISAGDGLTVFDTALGRIGIAICYDSEFPLLVRALCEAGADMILVPSCTEFVSGYHRVRTAALARALENGCVTVQSPTIGNASWSPAVDVNSGIAGIFVPSEHGLSDTGVLAEGRHGKAGWITATVDLGHLRHVRMTGEMRNAADWAAQPGAQPLAPLVRIQQLS